MENKECPHISGIKCQEESPCLVICKACIDRVKELEKNQKDESTVKYEHYMKDGKLVTDDGKAIMIADAIQHYEAKYCLQITSIEVGHADGGGVAHLKIISNQCHYGIQYCLPDLDLFRSKAEEEAEGNE